MSRLPRWAEKFFSSECSLGGAIASGPDEDANGWDFFIEFPEPVHHGPAETAPSRRQAFAQVKFTNGPLLATKVKLSNMLKSCSSADPWFVFLITKDKRLFGIHITDAAMTRALKEVRKARLAGRLLNRTFLPITFTASDMIEHGGNVVSWMLSQMGPSSERYSAEKSKIYHTSGYENGWGTGKFTLEFQSEDEVSRMFLGLSSGVKLQHFSVIETRFGVPEATPLHQASEGVLTVEPEPVAECEIKISGPPLEPRLSLSGQVYAFRFPDAPLERAQFRFSAAPLEILASIDGKMNLTFGLNAEIEYPQRVFDAYVTIDRWARKGALDIEVWSGGERAYFGVANPDSDLFKLPPSPLIEILKAIGRVAGASSALDITFGLTDTHRSANDLLLFGRLLSEGSLRAQIPLDADAGLPKEPFTELVYFLQVDLKDWTLSCVVSRSVIADEEKEGIRQITAGPPKMRDASVIKAASVSQRSAIEAEYHRIMRALEERETALGFGNLAQFIQEQPVRAEMTDV